MASENVTMRLELIAAKAKQMARDNKQNKLWPDDLARGVRELAAQIELVEMEARHDGSR